MYSSSNGVTVLNAVMIVLHWTDADAEQKQQSRPMAFYKAKSYG